MHQILPVYEYKDDLGDFIRELRKDADLTQMQAASLTGHAAHTTIARYELGKLSVPVGYLAFLGREVAYKQCHGVGQELKQEDIDKYKANLLKQINKALNNKEVREPKPFSFPDWKLLEQHADEHQEQNRYLRSERAEQSSDTLVDDAISSPVTQDQQAFCIISLKKIGLREINNLGLKEGQHTLLGIPVQTGSTVTTKSSERLDGPEGIEIELDPEIHNPRYVHFLLQAGWATLDFINQKIGQITLKFANNKNISTNLSLGFNIRDWAQNRSDVVNHASSPNLRMAWQGEVSDEVSGHIDLLTVVVPQPYYQSSLRGITVQDLSYTNLHSINPCIHLLGITVEYYSNEDGFLDDVQEPSQAVLLYSQQRDSDARIRSLLQSFDRIYNDLDGYDNQLGMPQNLIYPCEYATQEFQGGVMFWWDNPHSKLNEIYVIRRAPLDNNGRGWSLHVDTWTDGDPPTPPQELIHKTSISPKYGFGHLWTKNSGIRDMLGFPIKEEVTSAGGFLEKTTVQTFEGGLIFSVPREKTIWVLLDDGQWYVFEMNLEDIGHL